MAQEKEKLVLYKKQCRDLKAQLEDVDNQLTQYKLVESKADAKIQALNKIHQEKTKNLMNSITLLKKENRALEKQNSGGAQSKLIAQLNKDIAEQEVVIECLRAFLIQQEIPQDKVDEQIIKKLNDGPPKIRAQSREEMKIEIKKLQAKKGGGGGSLNGSRMNMSQVSNKSNNLDKTGSSLKEDDAQMDESMMSQDKPDALPNLILRLEDLKQKNDELQLNLKAEQEIIEKYEDELALKSDEINALRSAKTDLVVLTKKYEKLQEERKEKRKEENDKYIKNYDNELKVEELEIITKQQQGKLKNMQGLMDLEKESSKSKIDELEKRNKVLDGAVSQLQARYDRIANINKDLDKQIEGFKDTIQKLRNSTNQNEEKYKQQIKELTGVNKELHGRVDQQEKDVLILNQQQVKLQQTLEEKISELDNLKLKNKELTAMGDVGLITGANNNTGQMNQDNKDLRLKIRNMTKKEIELQDTIEQFQQEIKFREQKEKVMTYVNRKQLGNNVDEQTWKQNYMKEVQQRYNKKIIKLALRVKELEGHNKDLQDVQNMLESQADILIASEVSSDVSISLTALENIKVGSDINSDIDDLGQSIRSLISKDSQQLKKKVVKMANKQGQMQQQMHQLEDERDNLRNKQIKGQSDQNFDNQMGNMQKEYQKIIKDLSNKVADLEMQDVRLSRMSSNVGSDILSKQQYNENELRDMDSNISFSVGDIQQKEQNLSRLSSNVESMLMSDNDDQQQQQKSNILFKGQQGNPSISLKKSQMTQKSRLSKNNKILDEDDDDDEDNYGDEDFDVSSGISGISGINLKK